MRGATNYPLGLSVDDLGGALGLTAQVRGAGIDPRRICELMQRALEELSGVSAGALASGRCGPWMCCLRLSVYWLVEEWNAARAPYPADRCVHELLEEQVERTPERAGRPVRRSDAELFGAECAGEPAGGLPQ